MSKKLQARFELSTASGRLPGLNDVIMDYLVDIVDRRAATELVFRSRATKAISPGSWIVNCTGYVLKTDYPYEPYVSDGGAVFRFKHALPQCI